MVWVNTDTKVYHREGDRWYGRGSADNKGQHALNLSALEAVLAEREGKLGYNIKLVLETSEECGSIGLRDFVAAHSLALAADVLIASDGPRVAPEVPTIATGTRGTFHFDLVIALRKQNHSVYEIAAALHEQAMPLSPTAGREILRAEGFAPLPRRGDEERPAPLGPSVEPIADVRSFGLEPGTQFVTRCGGLLLFVPELVRLGVAAALHVADRFVAARGAVHRAAHGL